MMHLVELEDQRDRDQVPLVPKIKKKQFYMLVTLFDFISKYHFTRPFTTENGFHSALSLIRLPTESAPP